MTMATALTIQFESKDSYFGDVWPSLPLRNGCVHMYVYVTCTPTSLAMSAYIVQKQSCIFTNTAVSTQV